MSRKPKRKHKRHKGAKMPTAPQPESPPPNQTVSRLQIRFVEILGLFLTALGLVSLIALSPRLSGASQSPFIAGDQIPAFEVKNDGYIQLTDVNVACYARKIKMTVAEIEDTFTVANPPLQVLPKNDSLTLNCTGGSFMMAPASAIKSIDIAVVAYYRPWPFTFLRCRKFFRFEGRNDGTKVNWYKQ